MTALTTRSKAALVAFPVLLAVPAACDPGETVSSSPVPCQPAVFAPTYLPWSKGDPVPEPETSTAKRAAILRWDGPSGEGPVDPFVTLVTRYEEWDVGEAYPHVPVRGTEGQLVWIGDPGVGELALQWTEGDEPCDSYGLYLLDQDLSQRQAEAELEKIAESLE